jgi:uncharacterized protein with NRDE domain
MKNKEVGDFSSRGILILEYVKIRDETITAKKYKSLDQYEHEVFAHKFKGFNLIYGNIITGDFKYRQNDMFTLTEPVFIQRDVIHGMSNAGINRWDKVDRGKALFANVLKRESELPELADEILHEVL